MNEVENGDRRPSVGPFFISRKVSEAVPDWLANLIDQCRDEGDGVQLYLVNFFQPNYFQSNNRQNFENDF